MKPLGQWFTFEIEGTAADVAARFVPRAGRLVLVEIRLSAPPGEQIDPDLWRQISIARLDQLANAAPAHARNSRTHIELRPPAEPRYPDNFYAEVAAAYQKCVVEGWSPPRTIAAANGVPTSTVHRWVREARRRGLLPPARVRGQAG